MLPKWFTDWNAKNPTNIFGPAVVVGAAGSAVFVAAMLVSWGQPFATDSLQTGPRGTGMSVAEFVSDLSQPDPTVEGFVTSSPIIPQPGDTLAKDAVAGFEPLLGDLTVANYERLVTAMQSWTGIPDLLTGEENYQTVVARRMIQMTQTLNDDWGGHTQANAEVGVTCYTCHRGQPVPANVWYDLGPVNASAEGWSANQNRATMNSEYTSLPSDALQKYLVEGAVIAVHDLESRVAGNPGDEGFPTVQDTERTYALMNYFANSLGVNCVFCHNSRAFYDPAQVTPQWATASLGILMVQEVNNEYLIPLAGVLPANRMGPALGDVPKVACKTCHKGYQKPLGGLEVIANWPELNGAEPVYQ
jgi:photosynthetic reaction center cytochrome c subunit